MKDLLHKPWFTTLLGFIVGAILLALSFFYIFRDYLPKTPLTELGDRAFGELSLDQTSTEEALSARGGDAAKLAYPIIYDEFMPPQNIEAYTYVYDGELPDLSTLDATVYRRVNAFTLPASLSQGFSGLSFGLLPLSTFTNLDLLNISLAEESENGYTISLDTTSNSISLSRNNGYWSGFDYSRALQATDIPSNEALIDAARRFLDAYQFDLTSFGTPSVDRSYLDPESWIPDSMSVLYPLLIEEKEVWSMWGQPSGMSVSVSLRTGEIDGLWAPGPYTLEASTYALATDPQEVLDVAQRGGLWDYVPENPDVTYTFRLGEPDVLLVEHYQYDESTGSSTLYVPALRFPVVEGDPDAPYQRQWVIVPLVQDILDEGGSQGGPIIYEETLEALPVGK